MKYLLLLFTAICIGLSSADAQNTLEELESAIQDRVVGEDGTFAFAFVNLSDDTESILINPDTVFHAASTMKTPVMIDVFRRAGRGEFGLRDSVDIINRFYSIVDGSEFALDLDPEGDDPLERMVGERETIYNLTHAMITYSSNIGTNLILQIAEPEQVTETMRELGADNIEVLRGLFDMKAFNRGLNNTTTARDLAVIFEKLGRRKVVSEKASEQMISILKDQFYRDVIPARLPEDVVVANKTGWITGVVHDSGIVYLPDGRSFVIIFLSKNLPDGDYGREIGADLSKLVYDYMMNQ